MTNEDWAILEKYDSSAGPCYGSCCRILDHLKFLQQQPWHTLKSDSVHDYKQIAARNK